ncbi:uncharacterized protein VNE69_07173 [Vairimorpha necatrix]|uniref:Uncharacterized protein n=1 Tax=Vairimorpha necatrix TaxID=6039 RepID=A0AAX4JDM3_9MICR
MNYEQIKLVYEEINPQEISLYYKFPNPIHFNLLQNPENIKNIEIYKSTQKVEDFYLLPILEKILEMHNIENYDMKITYFEEMDSLFLFEIFVYFINKIFYTKCFVEKNEENVSVSVNGEVIFNTNII